MSNISEMLLSIKSKITSQSNKYTFASITILLIVLTINNIYFVFLLIFYLVFLFKRIRFLTILVCFVFVSIILLQYVLKSSNSTINRECRVQSIEVLEYNIEYTIKNMEDGKLYIFVSKNNYNIGDILFIKAKVEKLSRPTYPNDFDEFRYNKSNNIYGILSIQNIDKVKSSFSFTGSVYNYVSKRPEDVKRTLLSFLFKQHNNDIFFSILSLSGIVFSYLFYIVKKICFYFNTREWIIYTINIMILLICVGFRTYNYIVIRLIIYQSFLFINSLLKLYIPKQDINSLSFISALLFMPNLIMNRSWHFSYIINTFFYLGNRYLKNRRIDLSFNLIVSLLFLVTNLNSFPKINLLSVVLSFMLFAFLGKYLIFFLIFVVFAPFLDFLFQPIISYINHFFGIIDGGNVNLFVPIIPNIITFIVVSFIAISTYLKKKNRFLVSVMSIIMIFSLFLYKPLPDGVYFLDVEQGDSTIIIRNQKAMVIDAYNHTFDFLIRNNVRNIEYLLLTHSDYDHTMDAPKIIDYLKPKNILTSYYLEYGLSVKTIKIREETSFDFLDIKINVICSNREEKSNNDNSLCLLFSYLNYRFFLTGDISSKIEQQFISRYKESLDIDILKVAHHGSNTSSSLEFIFITSPIYAIISTKRVNSYGFPHKEVISNLNKVNAIIFQTSIDGSIIFTYDKIITMNP